MAFSRHGWKTLLPHHSRALSAVAAVVTARAVGLLASWAVLLTLSCATALAAVIPDGASYVPGEVILRFRPEASAAARTGVLNGLGATRGRALVAIGAERVGITRLAVPDAIERYRDDPAIDYIEPNWIYEALAAPNDPDFSQLWGLRNTGQTGGTPGADIGAVAAWESATGSSDVLVAVIDTGIDYNHPDLAANIYTNPGEIPGNGVDDDDNGYVDDVHGYDFTNQDGDPMDDNSHGTHVSGTIGAVGNNGIGVAGVNWHVKLLAVKFLSAAGRGTNEDAVGAIQYATQMGARIMSNSWGGPGFSESMRRAIQAANDAGVIFVAAAGNSGVNTDVYPEYPACYDVPNIVSVAATDHNDQLAPFSNYGIHTVHIAAPGVNVVSTLPDASYGSFSGTSMATPHVSGVFALMVARRPSIRPIDAISLLLATADRKPSLAGKMQSGGRLNAFLPIADPDSIPPAAVTDVVAVAPNATRITLRWTATGDDGRTGHPSRYDLRYATEPITEARFDSAAHVDGPLDPQTAGHTEQIEIHGLRFSTHYWFALRAYDEWGNPSPTSNLAEGSTLGPPDVSVSPTALDVALVTGRSATRTVTIENHGPGEMFYAVSTRPTIHVAQRAQVEVTRATEQAPVDAPFDRGHSPRRAPIISARLAAAGAEAATAVPFAGGLRIAIVQSAANASEMKPLLLGYPDVERVDIIEARLHPPTLERLAAYDGVVVIVQQPFADPAAIGDVLADYADLGGGLVLTVPTFVTGWAIQGRLRTGGYIPVEIGSGPIGFSALGSFNASHPIMKGVLSMTGDLRGQVAAAPDADVIARWDDGIPCVATRHGNVAALNLFLGSPGYWTGDLPQLLHSAVVWTSQTARWLTVDLREGVLPAGGRVDLTVALDASGLAGGAYDGQVVIASDDPDESRVVVAAHLDVTGAPDLALEGERITVESSRNYFVDGPRTTHSLAIAIPPTGPGSLELIADGDYADVGETATLIVEGKEIGTVGERGDDCTLHSGSFPVSAVDLARWSADGHVDAEVVGSAQVGAFCLTNRHVVRLRYPSPIDRLEFGPTFVGFPSERSVLIRNIGSTPLAIGSVASDRPTFTPALGAFSVNPGEVMALAVRFTPTVTGAASAKLSFATNDPDQPRAEIVLHGEGRRPPDWTISPARFDETLPSGGKVARTLLIENRGQSELEFDLTLVGGLATGPAGDEGSAPVTRGDGAPSDVSAAGPPITHDFREPTPAPPRGARSDQAPAGYRAIETAPIHMLHPTVLLVQDTAPWGTTSNEEVLVASGIEFDRATVAALAATDLTAYRLVIVAGDQSTAFYTSLAARASQLERFVLVGGVLEVHAAAAGWSGGDATMLTLPGGMRVAAQRSDYNLVLDTRHRAMVGVLNLFTGSPASHAHFLDIPQSATRLTTDVTNTPDMVEYRLGLGTVIAGCQPYEYAQRNGQHAGIILRNLIRYASELRPEWLLAGSSGARVPPGGRAEIALAFDAGAIAGRRQMQLVLRGNDPDRPEATVPITLEVDAQRPIAAELDARVKSFDPASRSKWLECRIELPRPYRADDVLLSTVRLNGSILAEHGVHGTETEADEAIGTVTSGADDDAATSADDEAHADGATIEDSTDPELDHHSTLTLRFRRAALVATLPEADALDLVVTGSLEDGSDFVAYDRVPLVRPRLLSPNGGEFVNAGRVLPVSWSVPRSWHVDRFDLELSTDGGTVWAPVASNLHGARVDWIVPPLPSLAARLRVVAHGAGLVLGHDSSDEPFRINLPLVDAEVAPAPRVLALAQNAPNPFAGATRIAFELPAPGRVRMSVYDMAGRVVALLADGPMTAGRHEVRWDGKNRSGARAAPGVYLYRIETPGGRITKRMALIE